DLGLGRCVAGEQSQRCRQQNMDRAHNDLRMCWDINPAVRVIFLLLGNLAPESRESPRPSIEQVGRAIAAAGGTSACGRPVADVEWAQETAPRSVRCRALLDSSGWPSL